MTDGFLVGFGHKILNLTPETEVVHKVYEKICTNEVGEKLQFHSFLKQLSLKEQ